MFELRKIGIVRRCSALLLDVILLAVLATGFMYLISLICNFDHEQKLFSQYNAEWDEYRKEYVEDVAGFYGFEYTENGDEYAITKDGQESTIELVMEQLVSSEGKDEETKAAYDAYFLLTPSAKIATQYKYVMSLLFMMISIGILLSYLVLEFILPIILKNGQTVGKKVFGICLVRPDCVKITVLALFARTILGKYAIETMFPVLLAFLFFFGGLGVLAIVLFAALLLLNIVLFFARKNRTPIHDILANTVAVDMRLQMIFQSEEELAEKKALHRKKEFLPSSKD